MLEQTLFPPVVVCDLYEYENTSPQNCGVTVVIHYEYRVVLYLKEKQHMALHTHTQQQAVLANISLPRTHSIIAGKTTTTTTEMLLV